MLFSLSKSCKKHKISFFLNPVKNINSISFSGKRKGTTTKVVVKMFFLRQKSKRKGKGAVSPAPLSFVSSLTKAHIKTKNERR